ncbi:MAG: transcription termination/antitermination protein NusG [Actinomycetota bacterium]
MNDPHRDTSETFAPEEGERLPDDGRADLAQEAPIDDRETDLAQDEGGADQAEPVVVGEADDDVDPDDQTAEASAEPIEDVAPAVETAADEGESIEPAEEEVEAAVELVTVEPAEEEVEAAVEPAAAKPVKAVKEKEKEAESGEEPETVVRDPFRGPGEWYVVHTYAGYENKVKTNLESRIHTMQMEEKIFDVHIPMEDVMEIKGGKKQVVQRKVFPGYLLVKMIYDNDSWYVVRNTPGVTGFVAAGTGSKPTPLSKREVEKILAVKKEEVKPQFRLGFEEGDVVRIISGPFADFNGTISEINIDQSKLKVLVNIFDRETPVELSFDQVAKV